MPFITDRANGTIAEGIIPLKRPSVMYHGNDDATTCKPIRFLRAIFRRRCDAGNTAACLVNLYPHYVYPIFFNGAGDTIKSASALQL